MKRFLLPLIVLAALTVAGSYLYVATRPTPIPTAAARPQRPALHGLEAVLYKSPTCGCCDGYADALTAASVNVRLVSSDAAVQAAKREHRIPPHGYSCHTFTISGYVVEGHVPLAALERLVTERPDVDGLVLPGMPVGTPGMPGVQAGPIQVLQLDGGGLAPYMTL